VIQQKAVARTQALKMLELEAGRPLAPPQPVPLAGQAPTGVPGRVPPYASGGGPLDAARGLGNAVAPGLQRLESDLAEDLRPALDRRRGAPPAPPTIGGQRRSRSSRTSCGRPKPRATRAALLTSRANWRPPGPDSGPRRPGHRARRCRPRPPRPSSVSLAHRRRPPPTPRPSKMRRTVPGRSSNGLEHNRCRRSSVARWRQPSPRRT
jgi:hypothetical protein